MKMKLANEKIDSISPKKLSSEFELKCFIELKANKLESKFLLMAMTSEA